MTAESIIRHFNMQPLPDEGGYFAVTFTADEQVAPEALPERYGNARNLGGAILFLETPEQFSAIHRLPTDELYYHHLGDPVEMLVLAPDGTGWTTVLGTDLEAGERPQVLAPRNHFHGSRPLPDGVHGFSLMSTSMAPGFDPADPEFPTRADLLARYPEYGEMVTALTRVGPWNV